MIDSNLDIIDLEYSSNRETKDFKDNYDRINKSARKTDKPKEKPKGHEKFTKNIEKPAKSCDKIKTFFKTTRADSNTSARIRIDTDMINFQTQQNDNNNENLMTNFTNPFTNKKKKVDNEKHKKNFEKIHGQKSNLCLYKTSDTLIKNITRDIEKFETKVNVLNVLNNPPVGKLGLRGELLRSLSKTKTPKQNKQTKQKIGFSPKNNKNVHLLNGGNGNSNLIGNTHSNQILQTCINNQLSNRNFNTQTTFNNTKSNISKDGSNSNLIVVKTNKVKEIDFINLTPKKDIEDRKSVV